MPSPSTSALLSTGRNELARAFDLTRVGVPIAGVLFPWFLVGEFFWFDELPILAAGLVCGGVVAVRRGRRLGVAIPLGPTLPREHGRLLLAVFPWFALLPAVFDFFTMHVGLLFIRDILPVVRDVGGWTAAGVVLAYAVAVLGDAER